MGVDAGIFAEKAKKYFWFDRLKNIEGFNYSDCNWEENLEILQHVREIWGVLSNYGKNPISAKDMLFLAHISKLSWENGDEDDRDRALWCDNIINFIKMFPDDIFTIKSDHGDEYPECMDKYEEIKEENLIRSNCG